MEILFLAAYGKDCHAFPPRNDVKRSITEVKKDCNEKQGRIPPNATSFRFQKIKTFHFFRASNLS